MLEGQWWVGEHLCKDILYDDLFSGGLDVFVLVSGGVWYSYNGLFGGFREGFIVDEVWVVDIGMGSGRWASGGHGDFVFVQVVG